MILRADKRRRSCHQTFGQFVLLFLRFLLHVREGAGFYQPITASIINHVLIGGEQEQGKKFPVSLKREKITFWLKGTPLFLCLRSCLCCIPWDNGRAVVRNWRQLCRCQPKISSDRLQAPAPWTQHGSQSVPASQSCPSGVTHWVCVCHTSLARCLCSLHTWAHDCTATHPILGEQNSPRGFLAFALLKVKWFLRHFFLKPFSLPMPSVWVSAFSVRLLPKLQPPPL